MEPPVQILSRRDLLQQPAAMLASAALIPLGGEAESAGAWYDRPMRRAQLTLVDDPGNYDLHFWVDYFRRSPSDVACLFAGGRVACYPTKVRFVPEGRRIRRVSLLVTSKAPVYRVAGKLVSMSAHRKDDPMIASFKFFQGYPKAESGAPVQTNASDGLD